MLPIKLPRIGTVIGVFVALSHGVGNGYYDLAGRFLIVPAALDGCELGRLIVVNVVPVEMSEKDLNGDQYGCKVQAHAAA